MEAARAVRSGHGLSYRLSAREASLGFGSGVLKIGQITHHSFISELLSLELLPPFLHQKVHLMRWKKSVKEGKKQVLQKLSGRCLKTAQEPRALFQGSKRARRQTKAPRPAPVSNSCAIFIFRPFAMSS